LAAGVVWLAGLVALGIWSEDVCMADGIAWAQGYRQSLRVWPPAVLCEYSGRGSVETVELTLRGSLIVGWTYLVPVFVGIGVVAGATGLLGRGADGPSGLLESDGRF
jgi:hypothetical protein